ncbi:MAG: hypothetical protein HQL67_04080 [Magnetococcales bacterium]|nr:hypothetical protein [Magnetococcales bacterium]
MNASSGVVSHTIRWQGKVPIGVELTLKGGVVVEVDLIEQTVVVVGSVSLKAKKQEWCRHIADYLARQALLEIQQEASKNRPDGRSTVRFDVRPDPNVTWWG